MTLYDEFWNTSIFGNSRAIWVIYQIKMPSENQFFLDKGVTRLWWGLGVLGGQVPRLYSGTIFGGSQHTWGVWQSIEHKSSGFLTHLWQLRGYSAFTDLVKNQSIGVDWGTLDTLGWIFEYVTDWPFPGVLSADFLGGLSLHLNHLIQSRMEISYRLFGTLPIGLLFSNLDSRQLETSPMTSYDQFWNMSTFDDSRAVRVICQKKMPSENRFFLDEGATRLRWGIGVLGGQVPRLYGDTIFGGVWHTWGVWRGI